MDHRRGQRQHRGQRRDADPSLDGRRGRELQAIDPGSHGQLHRVGRPAVGVRRCRSNADPHENDHPLQGGAARRTVGSRRGCGQRHGDHRDADPSLDGRRDRELRRGHPDPDANSDPFDNPTGHAGEQPPHAERGWSNPPASGRGQSAASPGGNRAGQQRDGRPSRRRAATPTGWDGSWGHRSSDAPARPGREEERGGVVASRGSRS